MLLQYKGNQILLFLLCRINKIFIMSSSYLQSYQADSLVKSIISKMMYTCTDSNCKHRVVRCTCSTSKHYNCAGFPLRQGCHCVSRCVPTHNNRIDVSPKLNFPQFYHSVQNPEDDDNLGRNSRQRYNRYADLCSHCVPPAGDYHKQEERFRWVNNRLHSGQKMKKVLYQSENPNSYIQSGPFSKNYDMQYQISEERIRRTRASSPEVQSKIGTLIRRDRSRVK